MAEVFEILGQFIANIGFPIAAFVLMYLQNTKMNGVISDLKNTVNENTQAIIQLKDRIE